MTFALVGALVVILGITVAIVWSTMSCMPSAAALGEFEAREERRSTYAREMQPVYEARRKPVSVFT